jgi:predicted nucleotide-binding protein
MTVEERAAAAIDMIDAQLATLEKIVQQAQTDEDHASGSEKLSRWKARTKNLLNTKVHSREGERLEDKTPWPIRANDPIGNLVDEAEAYAGLLKALKEELENHPSDVLTPPVHSEESAHIEVPSTRSNVVFIVHGHDELNLRRLQEILKKWNLEPIVLSRKPGRGRTLIEKFEDEAKVASYAFALLTPDDLIASKQEGYAQARPNVIFELGWFYGQLGRHRVCILLQDGTKIHSDLDGISRIEFKESVEDVATQVKRELVAGKMLPDS